MFITGASAPARADIQAGISITVYNNFGYNQSPPLPDVSGRPSVGTSTVGNIQQNFDQSPLFGMYEDFIVKYEGYITSPITGNITFLPTADDGTKFYLDGTLIDNNWIDKGGGGNPTDAQSMTAGVSVPFTYWFYENGGGAWTTLYWNIGNGWEVVPSSAFTQQAVPTTTTILRTIGSPSNLRVSSTSSGVLIEWDAPTVGNYQPERYAIMWSGSKGGRGIATGNVGDANALNTSVVIAYEVIFDAGEEGETFTFSVRSDNDTESLYSQYSEGVNFSVSVPTTTTTSTTTTTTTSVPATTTTQETTTTIKETTTTVSATTTTEASVATTTSVAPTKTTVLQQTEQQETTTTTIQATTTTLPSTTTTIPVQEDIVDEQVVALLNESASLSKDEIEKAVDDIIENGVSKAEANALAENPDVLQAVTAEQATEIFDAVVAEELSDEDAQQIVEAVQDAPQEVRESFEEEIDIFGTGKFDSYVPVDSTINVSQRRVVIAASAGAMLAAPMSGAAPSGGSPGGGSSGPSGGGSGENSDDKSNRRRNVRKNR